MKKVKVFITITLFFTASVGYYFFANSQYEQATELYNFPVPIRAKLIASEETELGKSYEWSQASGYNGIPLSYKLIIKKNGWKQGEIDGTNVTYSKGNQQINLSTDSDYLRIVKVE